MKKAHKIALLILAIAMLMPMSSLALADEASDIIQQESAQALFDLGLFKGTDKGFELDRSLTRVEGAVMLTRYLGGEAQALAGSFQSPFTDLPEWAKPYLGWLYEKGYAKGTTATTYTPNEEMKYGHFGLLMGRALGYTDDQEIQEHWADSAYASSYTEYRDALIPRGHGVNLARATLNERCYQSTYTLAAKLVNDGVLTAKLLDTVITPIYGCSYERDADKASVDEAYYVNRTVYGVSVARSVISVNETGKDDVVYNFAVLTPDYLTDLIVRSGAEIYALDKMTLAQTKIGQLGSPNGAWDIFFPYWDTQCVILTDAQGSGTIYKYKDSDKKLSPMLENCCTVPADSMWPIVSDINSAGDETTMLVSGAFGVISVGSDLEMKRLITVPAVSAIEYATELYYVPRVSDAVAREILPDPGIGFQWGGLELHRISAEGDDNLIATLDGKYGLMINGINQILGVNSDILDFDADLIEEGENGGLFPGNFSYRLQEDKLEVYGATTHIGVTGDHIDDMLTMMNRTQAERERIEAIERAG